MAIDPSIPLRALTQTGPPVEGPLDQYAKGLSLQNLMRQGQMGNLQLKEAQDQQKEQDAVKQIFQQGLPPDQTLKQLFSVSPSYAAQYQKALAESQKANADIGKTTADTLSTTQATNTKRLDMIGGLAQSVKGLPSERRQGAWVTGLQSLQSQGIDVSKFPPSVPGDDDLQSLIGTVTSAKDQMTQSREQGALDLQQSKFKDEQAQAASGVLIPGSEFINKQQQRVGVYRVRQQDGSYTQETRPLGEVGAAPRTPVPGVDVPLPPAVQQQKVDIAGATAQARKDATAATPAVDIQPGTKDFRLAQDLAYGKLPFSDFRSLYGRAASNVELKTSIYDKARELNPNFNPAAFEAGFKLASNPKVQQQLAAMDNVQQAVPDLLKLSDQATRTGVKTLNDWIIKGGVELGSTHYSNLQAARTAFADELSGALGFGSATDMSKEMGLDMTKTDLSPEAFRSAIQTVVVPFIQRKRDTLLKQMGIYGQPGASPAAGPAPVIPVNPYRKAQ